ncbi:MAG: FAD-dependent oxidoreductase [Clostridia bacterium]|nr:FAD-dependent oxidoreductase [Clostridia bacterium]
MDNFEVGIIGAGIVGSFAFNMLTQKGIKVCLMEAGADVCDGGATKANSAIIHAGYDCIPGTKKAFYNVRGNAMYEEIAKRLGEKCYKTGSLVVAGKDGLDGLKELYNRGIANGVPGLKILNKDELKKLEPNLSDDICYGLYAKTAKLVSPYNFAISLCEEAIINGGILKLNYKVDKICKNNGIFEVKSGKNAVFCKYLINCAGAGCAEINKLIGAEKLDITLTKGEYVLLDKTEGSLVSMPIFPLPTAKGKGILVLPTVSGNLLCGPTARDIKTFETSVSPEGVSEIKEKTTPMVSGLNFKKAIKLYAGVRVKCGQDFVIGFSKKVPNFYITAGISSPGLASSPAIAQQIVDDLIKSGLKVRQKTWKLRKPYTNVAGLYKTELNALIEKNSKFGQIICRCEGITEGEIEEVLNGPIKPLTIEGIKRRLRPTMGRCQGSFCTPSLINIVANFYKIDPKDVVFRGKTPLIVSKIKEGGIYEN